MQRPNPGIIWASTLCAMGAQLKPSLPLVLAAVFMAPVVASEEGLVYTRADVERAAAGEAQLRLAYRPRLALPLDDCPEGPFTCVEERVYGQVYTVSFVEETIASSPEGVTSLEHRDRGTLMIAAGFSDSVEKDFVESLIGHIAGLDVAAYAQPHAGMAFLHEPLRQPVLLQSTLPTWLCTELDGDYLFDLVVRDGRVERTYSRGKDLAERACRAIHHATEDQEPIVFRTMPGVRIEVRHEVRLQTASTLAGMRWADRLVELPEGVTFEKNRLSRDERTGGTRDFRDGVYRGHEGRYHDVQRDVLLPPASLDLAGTPMWVARWIFETTREEFGEEPYVERYPPTSIVMAVAPLADPVMTEAERQVTGLFVPDAELRRETLARLKRAEHLGPEVVRDAFADPETWPAQGDWIVVGCDDSGSAWYGIAPFSMAAPVANESEVCSIISLQLE